MGSLKKRWRVRPALFAVLLAWGWPLLPSFLANAPSAQADTSAASGARASDSEGRYRISARASHFIVRAFAGGLLSAFAHDHTIAIRDFDGEVRFTYVTVEPASLQLTIKADSLAVMDKVSEADRKKIQETMRGDVLEVANFPDITFHSTSVSASRIDEGRYQAKITGDLTLHGVTRPLIFVAGVTFYETSLRAQGQFALRQSDFGIKPVSVAGGTVKVKDELKFSFDIIANR